MIRLVQLGAGGASPPLVAIPGIDGSSGSLLPIVRGLAERRRVVVVDYTDEQATSVEQLSEEIARALRKELGEPVDLLGQSIGTIFAAQLDAGSMIPSRRIVLCCTFTRLRWTALRLSNAMLRLTPSWLYRAIAPASMAIVCGPVGDGADHPFFAASRAARKEGIIKRTGWEIGRDFATDLARVRSPLLVLMGQKDRFVPNVGREVEKLARLFDGRDARVRLVPGAGHVVLPSGAIEFVIREIEGFLA
jgi:pimeloyl-ACP methyl ester carboxylesterase